MQASGLLSNLGNTCNTAIRPLQKKSLARSPLIEDIYVGAAVFTLQLISQLGQVRP